MGKLVVLMITAFIDMVGLLMLLPLLPFYATNLGAGGFTVGLLVSSFAAAQILSAPFWGRFSDRYGRRPALMVGLGASAAAYVIFAFANTIELLFLSRIVQGAGGGTVGVIQAYVADAVPPEQRAKGLGWLSAATNAGVAIGPVFGGLALAAGGVHAPGLAAATLCLVNIVFARRFLTESRDMAEARANVAKRGRSREAVMRVLTHSRDPAARLIWIYAVAMGAFQGVTAILALFLAARFGVTEHTIWYFFMYIGVLSVLARAVILGPAVDRLGEARLSRLGSALLAAGLAMLAFMQPLPSWEAAARTVSWMPVPVAELLPYLPLAVAVALIPLGTAFTFPCVTAMLSRVIPSHERGLFMGVQQTFGGVARVVFPILAGAAFDRYVGLPFLIAAALVAFTLYLGRHMDRYVAGAGR